MSVHTQYQSMPMKRLILRGRLKTLIRYNIETINGIILYRIGYGHHNLCGTRPYNKDEKNNTVRDLLKLIVSLELFGFRYFFLLFKGLPGWCQL